MYKLIAGMMARLKSLDFEISFETTFSSTPLSIKYNSEIIYVKKGKTFLPLTVTNVGESLDIEFNGFVPNDTTQKIIVDLYCEGTKLDTVSLCTFEMKDNQFVNNVILKEYNEIFFNGILTLQFFRSWFECNLLAGCYLNYKKSDYLNWRTTYQDISIDRNRVNVLKKYNTICIGASLTHGTNLLSPINAWPGQLQKMLNVDVGNFGVLGADHFTVMHNMEYIINNFDVDRIIVLLPGSFILPKRVSFLGSHVFLSCLIDNEKLYSSFKLLMSMWIKKNILKENYIKKFLSNKLKKIEDICADRNIQLCLIHQNVQSRDEFNYNSIRIENFVFPTWNKNQSLEDGFHPDETVHLKFAKQVIENL
jgi:hypothetical protein